MNLVNRTRISNSIPRRLFQEGNLHLLPLYYLARLSYLATEGIDNSGSCRFADHIYVGKARGRYGIGKLLDAVLLRLPSCRSFRNRYAHSRDQITERLLQDSGRAHRVLSVACGIPRDLMEAAGALERADSAPRQTSEFFCMDLDPAVLSETQSLLPTFGTVHFELVLGDAFDERAYPDDLDLITSTGMAEFLSDLQLVRLYNIWFGQLRRGGVLVTSHTVRHRVSDYLLRQIAELFAYYRDEEALSALFARTPFQRVTLTRDAVGYQVLVLAERML